MGSDWQRPHHICMCCNQWCTSTSSLPSFLVFFLECAVFVMWKVDTIKYLSIGCHSNWWQVHLMSNSKLLSFFSQKLQKTKINMDSSSHSDVLALEGLFMLEIVVVIVLLNVIAFPFKRPLHKSLCVSWGSTLSIINLCDIFQCTVTQHRNHYPLSQNSYRIFIQRCGLPLSLLCQCAFNKRKLFYKNIVDFNFLVNVAWRGQIWNSSAL